MDERDKERRVKVLEAKKRMNDKEQLEYFNLLKINDNSSEESASSEEEADDNDQMEVGSDGERSDQEPDEEFLIEVDAL